MSEACQEEIAECLNALAVKIFEFSNPGMFMMLVEEDSREILSKIVGGPSGRPWTDSVRDYIVPELGAWQPTIKIRPLTDDEAAQEAIERNNEQIRQAIEAEARDRWRQEEYRKRIKASDTLLSIAKMDELTATFKADADARLEALKQRFEAKKRAREQRAQAEKTTS